MKTNSTFKFKTNSIYRMEDGIICFKANEDDLYDVPDLMQTLSLCEEANDGKPFLLMMDIGGYDFLMTKAGRKLFNTYPKALELIIAEAAVINSVSGRILYNLLVKFNRPKFPFKAFNSADKARAWLLSIS